MHYLVTFATVLSLSMVSAAEQTNESISQSIAHALMDDEIEGVEVTVDGDRVMLAGNVETLWAKQRASEIALGHNHIDSVDNRVSVKHTSDDRQIAEDVASRLNNYVHYSIYDDVKVNVREGTVVLDGKVTWGFKSQEMERLAARIPGVRAVENRIEVLPSSPNDQQIRNSIASRIYGDSMFMRYAIQPTPPIHIIVENGHVTLTGGVQTRIEKRRAEILARQAFGVFSVTNELSFDNATASQ